MANKTTSVSEQQSKRTSEQESTRTVELRRAPKYFPFLMTGAVSGLVLAVIIFFVTGQLATQDSASVLGLLVLAFVLIGGFGGIIVAWLVDTRSLAAKKVAEATKLEQ